MRELPTQASVVVIGGGAIGTSIACHLAEAGVDDLVLLERGALGSGTTGRAVGGVRAQFSDPLNVAIARRSQLALAAMADRPGPEIGLEQDGYLFLLSRAEDVEEFKARIELQRAMGVPSRLVGAEELKDLCPLLEADGFLAGAFSLEDGYASTAGVLTCFAAAARRRGARLLEHCAVEGVRVRDGRVQAVQTAAGTIATEAVVCAGGPWSRSVGEMAGVELEVTPLRRDVLVTKPIAGLPAGLPMTVDFATGFYFRPENEGVLMGIADPGTPPGFDAPRPGGWPGTLLDVAARVAPATASAGVERVWSGYYEMTPDCNALIGEAPHPSRFLYATGFSGHGFLQAPGVGEIVRDLLLRRPPFVDVAPLAAERFAEATRRPELNVI